MEKPLSIVIIIALCALVSACGGSGNKANILPADLQYSADTMYNHHRNRIIDRQDSICSAHQQDMIQRMTDSLVRLENVRINEITK